MPALKIVFWPKEKLIGDLDDGCSRRIDIEHRLVSEVFKKERTVRVPRMWTLCV